MAKIDQILGPLKEAVNVIDSVSKGVTAFAAQVAALNQQLGVTVQLGNQVPKSRGGGIKQAGESALGPNINVTAPHPTFAPMPTSTSVTPLIYTNPMGGTNGGGTTTPAQQQAQAAMMASQGATGGLSANIGNQLNQTMLATNRILQQLSGAITQLSQNMGNPGATAPGSAPGSAPGTQPPPASQGFSGRDMAKMFKESIGAIAAVGTAGYSLWYEPTQAMRRTNLGAVRRAESSEGDIAQTNWDRYQGSVNINKSENLLRYYGDVLSTRNSTYLGASGRNRALDLARREFMSGTQIQMTDAQHQAISGGVGAAMGAAQMAGAGFSGGALGLALAGNGVSGLTSGVNQFVGAYNGPSDQLFGGALAGTAAGRLFLGSSEAGRQALENMRAARSGASSEALQRAQELEDSGVKKNAALLAGLDQIQQGIEVRKQGAMLIGGYARGGYESLQEMAASGAPTAEDEHAALSVDRSYRDFKADRKAGAGRRRGIRSLLGSDYFDDMKMRNIRDDDHARGFAAMRLTSTSGGSKGALYDSQRESLRRQIEYTRTPSHSVSDSDYATIIGNFESRGAGGYQAENATTHAMGRYQIMPMWASKFEKETGIKYADIKGNPAAQDAYFNKVMLPEYKANAGRLGKVGLGSMLNTQELVSLQQLGYGNLEHIFNGTAGGAELSKVLPQIPGIIRSVDRSLNMSTNSTFLKTLSSAYGFEAFDSTRYDKTLSAISGQKLEAQSAANSFGMTVPEFYGHRNRLLNMIRPEMSMEGAMLGEGGNVAKTGLLLNMERSGMGSFDQLLGNLGSLNRNRGGQDNVSTLNAVLTQAVAQGFDRSRTAQQFVGAVSDLTGEIKTSNAESITNMLGGSVGFLSSTPGRGDEKSIALAKSGIQGFEDASSSTQGLIGSLKTVGLIRAGFKLKNGLGEYAAMGGAKVRASLDSVNSLIADGNFDPNSLEDFQLQQLARTAPGSTPRERMMNLAKGLSVTRSAENAYYDSTVKAAHGPNASARLAALKGMPVGASRTEAIRQFESEYAVALTNTGLSPQSATVAAVDRMIDSGLISPADGTAMKKSLSSGMKSGTDVADTVSAYSKDATALGGAAALYQGTSVSKMRKTLHDYAGGAHLQNLTLDSSMYNKYLHSKKSGKAVAGITADQIKEIDAELPALMKDKRALSAALASPGDANEVGGSPTNTVKIDAGSLAALGKAIVDTFTKNGYVTKNNPLVANPNKPN